MASSQIQQSQPPNSISIDTIESSVKDLVKKWHRRQRWQLLFHYQEQQEHVMNVAPWRTQLANFLESMPIHLLSISLLLVDLIFTILDLSSSLLSCTSKKNKREDVLYHWGGIAILSLLATKILALAVALGSSFFMRPGHLIDGLVVAVALILETLLEGKGAGLLIVVSLWRVVRVVESAFELSNEAIEAQIEGIVCQLEVLRDENCRLQVSIVEKDKRIAELEEALSQYGHACQKPQHPQHF